MESILFEVVLIFILLLLNGVFSMSELAVVSARRIRLQQQAETGSKGAQTAIELAENPSTFLSTVQIGITLIGILAGAFGGASIAEILAGQLNRIEFLAPYSGGLAFALVVGLITYFSIIIGELIPKSLALNAPEKIAVLVSRPMKILSRFAAPIVWLLTAPTGFVLRVLRIKASVEPPITDEEIKGLINVGTQAGVFEETEQDILESVIHLDDQRVSSVMTPRTKISWLDLNDEPEKIRQMLGETRFSRFPVARGSLDDITGYASAKALLGQQLRDGKLDPTAALSQPLFIPETLSVLNLLEKFRASHTHFAIVVDEFGGVEGLVTINDVLEAIIGELATSQHGLSDESVERRADGTFVIDGQLSISDFKELLEVKELPGEDRGSFQTAAGFVLTRLGKIPENGDHLAWNRYDFEIVSMERNRIDKILIKMREEEAGD